MINWLQRNFGTHRGFIRLWISRIKLYLGHYRQYENVQWDKVERLVFVCLGNICRSPFGHHYAAKSVISVASIGVSTTTGAPADPQATKIAQLKGVDMTQHIATNITDYQAQKGDLLLMVEDRHLAKLGDLTTSKDVQITLLGLWSNKRFPLLYDPHTLSDEYFDTCFKRIINAVDNILAKTELK
jgi:protein-tyrosine phosphatase